MNAGSTVQPTIEHTKSLPESRDKSATPVSASRTNLRAWHSIDDPILVCNAKISQQPRLIPSFSSPLRRVSLKPNRSQEHNAAQPNGDGYRQGVPIASQGACLDTPIQRGRTWNDSDSASGRTSIPRTARENSVKQATAEENALRSPVKQTTAEEKALRGLVEIVYADFRNFAENERQSLSQCAAALQEKIRSDAEAALAKMELAKSDVSNERIQFRAGILNSKVVDGSVTPGSKKFGIPPTAMAVNDENGEDEEMFKTRPRVLGRSLECSVTPPQDVRSERSIDGRADGFPLEMRVMKQSLEKLKRDVNELWKKIHNAAAREHLAELQSQIIDISQRSNRTSRQTRCLHDLVMGRQRGRNRSKEDASPMRQPSVTSFASGYCSTYGDPQPADIMPDLKDLNDTDLMPEPIFGELLDAQSPSMMRVMSGAIPLEPRNMISPSGTRKR